MSIDENKYNTLFITKFKANEDEFLSELKRVKDYYGKSEEIKLEFYKASFKALIAQFKRELPKDENYDYIITTLYNYFIKALKEDGFDASQYTTELEAFRATELPKLVIQKKVQNNYIPQYKAYNLNTKYGRRKAREQALRNYENGTPEYRQEIDNIKTVVWLIIIVIVIIGFIIKAALTSK
jgi:hypothetical protein